MICNVIIIEDEPLIAVDIEFAAQDAGCTVLGIARTIGTALQMLDDTDCNGVILDANLGGVGVKPVMDKLIAKNVPFIVVSGYTRDQLEFLTDDVVLVGKPFAMTHLTETIRQEIVDKSGGI